jgi:hypothetical protein
MIILYFNIFPIWQNNKFNIIHINKAISQNTNTLLKNYLVNQNPNNVYFIAPSACACWVTEVLPNGGGLKIHKAQEYFSKDPNFVQYASGYGVTPSSKPPDEYGQDDGNTNVDFQEPPEIEPIDPSQLFPIAMSGGNEGTTPPLPGCTDIVGWAQYFFEYTEGEAQANMYPQSFINTPNLPCSNNFLLGGNIINFPLNIASSIGQYNFEDNFINAIKLNNATNDVFNKMVRYDIIETTIIIGTDDPTFCNPVMGIRNILQNMRGTYKFVCYTKLGSTGTNLVGEVSSEVYVTVKKDLPANLLGAIFTLPPASITPAQVGINVSGVDSSNNINCQTLDCAKVANGTASTDNCGACTGGTTGAQPCSQTPSNTIYYTTLNSDTTKYYNNDTIYIPQRNVQIKLTIHKKDGTLAATDLIWKRKDTTKCTNAIECFVSSNTLGVTVMRVDSGTTILIKNPLAIYKVPTLYFKIGLNYKGEYGFDDSAHLHTRILNNPRYNMGTKIKTFGQDTSYRIPWMSLLDGHTATIRDSLANFSREAKKDKNGYVEFRQSIISNNKILMYGSNNPKWYYTSLNTTNTFNIYAQRWKFNVEVLRKAGNFNDLVSNIYAITNTGDTIGQMRLTCDIATPKKVIFIYVNTGNGYRNISKQLILDSLNKNSHNQILRKWVLDTSVVRNSNGRDTINLTNEFTLDSTKFMNPDTLLKPTRINEYYLNHKNIDINYDLNSGVNIISGDSAKVHVVFILNYSILASGGGTVASSDAGGYRSAWWVDTDYKAAAHEMGHLLNMAHTWNNISALASPNPSIPGYLIPKYSTKNLMDYANIFPDPTEMFYFAQWVNCF